MYKVILSYSILACIVCNAQNITNGTELADNLTSRSRVVVDAFENASNRVHALIQEVSPAPDLSGYATTGSVAAVSNAVAQKADLTRVVESVKTYLIPNAINGGEWATGAAGGISELYYNAISTAADTSGKIWWSGSRKDSFDPGGGMITVYTWATAYYSTDDDTMGAFLWRSASSELPADVHTLTGYDKSFIFYNNYDNPNGWLDVFSRIDSGESVRVYDPDYGDTFETIFIGTNYAEKVTVHTESVVYSDSLDSATNAIAAMMDGKLSTTGGVVNGNVDFLDGMMNISDIETYMYRASITELNLQYPEYVNIGAGYTPLTSIFNSTNDYVRKNNGTATNLTANILTVGSRIAGTRGNDSASFGGNHLASGLRAIAMGQGANATNAYSIVFNGYGTGKYGSHGVGTANFNPREGAYGFYVGESNLHQVVESLIALDKPVVVTNRDDNDAVISVVTNQPLDLVRASEIADYIPQMDTFSFATKDELSPISGAVNTLWTYVYGESVWIAVTNYMRTIGGIAPSFQLWEVRGGNTNLVYWSKEEITNVTADLMYDCKTQMEASVAAVTNKFAWSAYQSASGERNPQPTAVTIVSTPSIMLTGGGEWYKCIDTGSSAVWVLKSNGLNTFGGDTNGYFRIVDDEGNAQFEVIKTASYEVGALATSTDFSPDNEFQVTYNAQGNEHPFILATTDLGTPFIQEENGAINSLGITTTWDKVDGNWRVTISQDERSSSLFVHAKMIVQGENVIKNNAPIDVSGGILCTDGVHKVRPVYTNGVITWEVVQ